MLSIIFRIPDMLHLYVHTLLKYSILDGRASRTEFCLFSGINMLILSVLSGTAASFNGFSGQAPIYFAVAVLAPTLTLSIRRMHDCGKKGWYLFIPVYNLILALSKGENKKNEYGPAPEHLFKNQYK